MSKVAIYCRVSTQMQSTDRQREELLERAKIQEVVISENHIYIDVISGFTKGEVRPQYIDLMDAVDRKEINEIWFSEMTRLGRSSVELLSEIQKLQAKGVSLYFQKQNITVTPDKNDLGSNILLAVLAVCASYEIELFAERSISGKINKIKVGGGVGGDDRAYGYTNDKNKKMIVRPDEAETIRTIFEQYANGKSTLEIAESLNAQGTPTSLTTRAAEAAERRESKGLSPKENPHLLKSTQLWKPSMVSKLLSKDLYTGHRYVVFHKPNLEKGDDGKPVKKEREVHFKYDKVDENLRIVSDELFQQVQERLLTAPYNKNNAIKHENLLKPKLRCGECNSNFTVGKSTENTTGYLNGGRSYRCYGRINRRDKPSICSEGADIKQWRLDGLVLSLSLKMFANIDLKKTTESQITDLSKRNNELAILIDKDKATLERNATEYKQQLKRLSKLAVDDTEADELISELQTDYVKKKSSLNDEIERLTKEKVSNAITINNLKTISKKSNLYDRMDDIWRKKDVVKTMVDELISEIVIYRPHPNWLLVVVKYKNNVELWGTVKSKKYKLSEMFYDEMVCNLGIEFYTWYIDNTDHNFNYDAKTKLFTYDGLSKAQPNIAAGTYTFEQLQKVLYETKWMATYPFYCYENNEYNINPPRAKDESDFFDFNHPSLKDSTSSFRLITAQTPEWKKKYLQSISKKTSPKDKTSMQ